MGARPSRRIGFTLIELLVVIAFISILAAILMPVFAQAKNSAKHIACMVHMRQIGTAHFTYMSDHDDTWCPAISPSFIGAAFAPQQPWIGYDNNNAPLSSGFYGRVDLPAVNPERPGALDPYIRNRQLKRCPSMPSEWQSSYALNWFNPAMPSAYYAVNPAAQGQEFGPSCISIRSAADGSMECDGGNDSIVELPAETLILWEHKAQAPLCDWLQPHNWFIGPPDDPTLKDHFHFLHRSGANAVWGDSHAKRITYHALRRPWFSSRKGIYPAF